jgi:hypothetical protein
MYKSVCESFLMIGSGEQMFQSNFPEWEMHEKDTILLLPNKPITYDLIIAVIS